MCSGCVGLIFSRHPNAELPLRPPDRPRYCDAGLVPKFSYDFEKAELLNCAGACVICRRLVLP